MPIKQLRVVEKIKFLVANRFTTKKQIVDEVETAAREHHQLNQRQEKEDEARVDHAVKELNEENEMASRTYSRILNALAISVIINFIFLAAFALMLYFLLYR